MEPICFNRHAETRPTDAFKKGDRVRIAAGTKVKSMYPGRQSYVTQRAQVIKVHHELGGRFVSVDEALDEYAQELQEKGFDLSKLKAWREANSMDYYSMMVQVSKPSVRWPGTGGYWCEVDASLVERVDLANALGNVQEPEQSAPNRKIRP